jgi:putative transposase
MAKGLQRFHSGGDEHFITCSCYHRQPLLASARRRDLFLKFSKRSTKISVQRLGLCGYAEHFHLLIGKPGMRNLALAMQVFKQRVSCRFQRRNKKSADQIPLWQTGPPAFWQKRYYDFNVFSQRKHAEKLNYMHNNPVKRGVESRSCGAGAVSAFTDLANPGPCYV